MDYVSLYSQLSEIAGDGAISTIVSTKFLDLRYYTGIRFRAKQTYLPYFCSGGMAGVLCLTEPHVEPDASDFM